MVAIPFSYNLAAARVAPAANAAGLTYMGSDGLQILSGLDYYTGLSSTDFYSDAGVEAMQSLGQSGARTLTTAEFHDLHLVSGEKIVIDYSYYPGDYQYNDFAFAMLKDSSGTITPELLDNENNVVSSGYQNHFVSGFTVGPTGSYDLLLAAADVGDIQEPSLLVIHSVSVEIPTGDYLITGNGVRLSDGSVLNPDGSLALAGGGTDPGVLSSSASGLVTKLDNLVNANLIAQSGIGLISQDGNGVVATDGSGLIGGNGNSLVGPDGTPLVSAGNASLISQDGNGLISQDGNGLISTATSNWISTNTVSLISQDGNGLVSHNGGDLISQDGNGLISQDGNGLTGNTYSALFLDESGGLARQFTGSAPALGTIVTVTTQTGPATPGTPVLVSLPSNANFLEQLTPSVAALANGQLVVTWTTYDPNNSNQSSIHEQILNADGSTFGGALSVASTSGVFAQGERVTALVGGGYVIAWNAISDGPPATSTLAGVVFDATGARIGATATPAGVSGMQNQVSIAALADGGFVETWQNTGATSDNNLIMGQIWAADGTTVGTIFNVGAQEATTNASNPSVAALQDGGFVIVYADAAIDTEAGPVPGISADVYASGGSFLPIAVPAGLDGTLTQLPVVATLANGDFVVAWNEDTVGGGGSVMASIYTAAGVQVGNAFVVTDAALPNLDPPAIAALGDGRFAISWTTGVTVGANTNDQVSVQVYNADGSLSGTPFSGSASGYVGESALATLTDGRLEVASADSNQGSTEIHVEPVSFAVAIPGGGPAIPGTEFLIGPSAVSPFFETVPSTAALTDGDFAVAWRATAGSQVSIQVQLERPGGAAFGSLATIAPIATHALDSISMDPIVLGLSTGGFAVVYLEGYVSVVHGVVTSPANVYAQLFDSTGAKLGDPSLLAATNGLQVSDLAAVALPDGSFVTTATHYDETSAVTSLVAQRYTDSGATIGDAMTFANDAANITNVNTQGQALTPLANGGFAVAFANVAFAFGPGALQTGMYVQIFDSVGTAGAPVLIRSSAGAVVRPAIATLANGNFVVAWNEGGGTNNSTNTTCNAQLISPTGTLIGSVITGQTGLANFDPPAVAALADGRFIVAYDLQSAGSGGAGNSGVVQAQIYNADGSPSGAVIAGNAPDPATFIASPAVVQIADGDIELVSAHSGGEFGGSDIHDEPLSLLGASQAATQQGRAVDGYISGATVFADANGDGIHETGEAIATTDAFGRYNFTTPASGTVILTGGTDASTGLAFTGTLTAPAGSLTVSPLSTLVQRLVAGGLSLTDAQIQLSTAFDLAADTDFTTLDPVLSTLDGLADGAKSFVASITVADVAALATAAGATGDIYDMLASQIAAGAGSFDPTSVAAIEGLGLTGSVATAVSSLAAASHDLALQQVTADAANPAALLSDGAAIQLVEQGQVAPALAAAVTPQDLDPVVAAYTGSNLTASVVLDGPTACFASGTRIASPDGGVAVEALAVGDLVLTAGGAVRAIKWLGHRHIDCRRHARPQDVWPVRIAPNAFAPGQPSCNLWLSPDHAVLIDGVLIPVRFLVNDATIVQEARSEVTYWHVELARHDVILAHGLPCESYLDTGNRAAFANGGPAVAMHPDFALRVWDRDACAPLVRDGAMLATARRRLLDRAATLGHALTGDAGLQLLVDGRAVLPQVDGAMHRFRLPPTAGSVRLISRNAVPAHVSVDSSDHRRLGVAISRLAVDGYAIALSDPRLSSGWHKPESDWRWTDGDAGLALAGVSVLEVEVAMTERYWVEPVVAEATRPLARAS